MRGGRIWARECWARWCWGYSTKLSDTGLQVGGLNIIRAHLSRCAVVAWCIGEAGGGAIVMLQTLPYTQELPQTQGRGGN
jgi:hypothetical protein